LQPGDIETLIGETLKVVRFHLGIDDMEGTIIQVEPFLDERHRDRVFLVTGVKERACVPGPAKLRACKAHGVFVCNAGQNNPFSSLRKNYLQYEAEAACNSHYI
jgi:hypothetical protein